MTRKKGYNLIGYMELEKKHTVGEKIGLETTMIVLMDLIGRMLY